MSSLAIRPERSGDFDAIASVIEEAFRADPRSDRTEHFIVAALRRAGALSVSLVAELDGRVVGHVAFSPVTISDGSPRWFGLAPVSVLPAHQRRGIGTELVERGLAELRSLAAAGCVVLGNPSYYGRFGFESRSDCILPGLPPEYFQALTLAGPDAVGEVTYHAAFGATR
jgi:putative acetyltransferase